MATEGCIFCGIARGEAEASLVHEGPRTLAFLDIAPVTPGHLLVVPRAHASSLSELDPDDGSEMFRVAQRLAAALRRSGLRCEGVNLFLADGAAAGQEVFHAHLHVLPRYDGDGFGVHARFGSPSRDQLDDHAATLRALLD